ncbi:MAG: ribosome maturation factor RimP [Thermoflexibacter sp.]
MDLKQKIRTLVEEILPEDLFLVDLKIHDKNNRSKIVIALDGDKGISLDQCAEVSRKVGEILENQNIFTESYVLEVSSTGIDQPLKMKRQYLSRIGKKLKVELLDGSIAQGILNAVTEDKIVLLKEEENKRKSNKKENKKAKQEDLLIGIAFSEIKQTNVLISFN